ncbi:hypothetical protein P262_02529 [Cronobacter malonaticus]|uniref:Uncharacterized protein n=1 Tax=Cronobacter malonaticus TaxID=413503 RepID=V5U037_9ENTR|nr:hypothetical protein P262_02529 [Cronobacter malonaticus]CCJ92885.1 hypothetical protein BN131_558 [Cronobacter malonaticus 681]
MPASVNPLIISNKYQYLALLRSDVFTTAFATKEKRLTNL